MSVVGMAAVVCVGMAAVVCIGMAAVSWDVDLLVSPQICHHLSQPPGYAGAQGRLYPLLCLTHTHTHTPATTKMCRGRTHTLSSIIWM